MDKLKRHSQFETHDVNRACEYLEEVLHRRVRITDHRRFHCAMATATLQTMAINYLELSGDMTITTQADEILYLLVRMEAGLIDRQEKGEKVRMVIPAWGGMVVPPKSSATAQIAGGLKATVFCIPVAGVELEAERLFGMRVKQPMELIQIINMGPDSYLGQRINFMLEQLELPDGVFTRYPLLGFDFQRELVRTLIEILPNSYFGLLAERHGPARRHVKMLEQFLMQHLRKASDVDLAAMAKAVGVSQGTLRTSCRRELDQTPEELYASLRVHAAHERLENPLLIDTVACIAREFGFTNPKRFADLYKSFLHGESPAETLQRGQKKLGRAAGGK